ncbi:hypothetical protein BC830DRAFT_915716 [Chytriomyces sp. MP71]|nr:hypothetical protein BC830DRAFT_915716 [Chytriomyces sp. MP71]
MLKRQIGTVPSVPPASVSPKASEGPAVSLSRPSVPQQASPSPVHSVPLTTVAVVPTSNQPSPVPSQAPPPQPRPSPLPFSQSQPQQMQPQQPQPVTQQPQSVVPQSDQASPTAQPASPFASQSVSPPQNLNASPMTAPLSAKVSPSSSLVPVSKIANTFVFSTSNSPFTFLTSSSTVNASNFTASTTLLAQDEPLGTTAPTSTPAGSNVAVTETSSVLTSNSADSSGQQGHMVAIAAGVIGSLVFLIIAVAALIFYRKRGIFSKAGWRNSLSRTGVAGAADFKNLTDYDVVDSSAFVVANASGLESGYFDAYLVLSRY